MGLSLAEKEKIVAVVNGVAMQAPLVVAAEYIGLNVADMTVLRSTARSAGVYIRVVRNTLARHAFSGTPFECMRDGLVGPLLLAFSMPSDVSSAARVIRDFAKNNDKLVVKMVALDGGLYSPSDLDQIANLPSFVEARALLLGLMQAPASKLVRTLAEPGACFARLLAARREEMAKE